MISKLQNLIATHVLGHAPASGGNDALTLQVATAVLLLEVAAADDHVSAAEREQVDALVARLYALSAGAARELSAQAVQLLGDATSLFPFTRLITSECSMEQRVEIVRMLWEVVFVDDAVHTLEEHLVRKVADLLYVPHSQFIRTKLQAAGKLATGPEAAD
jgi:uncharacterized tellurite resistance protein B-like protein